MWQGISDLGSDLFYDHLLSSAQTGKHLIGKHLYGKLFM